MSEEIKTFLNPDIVRLDIEDITGKTHRLSSQVMTLEKNTQMQALIKGVKDLPIAKVNQRIRKQLVIIFGNDEKFYENFDVRLLVKVLNYYTEQIKNPTKGAKTR